eukprot:752894_1
MLLHCQFYYSYCHDSTTLRIEWDCAGLPFLGISLVLSRNNIFLTVTGRAGVLHATLLYDESGITRYEDHSIRATDGVVIQARLFHSLKEAEILALSPPLPHITFNSSNKDATVVVVHGHGANMGRQVEVDIHSLIHRTVRPLLAAGFTVMAIDLRNHGRSGVSLPITFGLQEKHDVLGSVDWIIENADKF